MVQRSIIMNRMTSYPVDEVIPELKEKIASNSAAVLQAPPGAGKTTRVPLSLLEILPYEKGRIVMLEPRRLAAVNAARWMAHLLGEDLGSTVGYSIRFDSKVSSRTRIEVVTEGILTRRIQSDPALEGVAAVIFDEFHERSIHADLALALCLDLKRNLREDLKILVMSATLDCEPVSALLGDAPVIASGGKSYPVEERYFQYKGTLSLADRITTAVKSALNETSGDILVFLPGAGEIRACSESLRQIAEIRGNISIHPLYGDLPFEEQERAILPSRNRKIVLATNIAETSLTIEGVKVVIDSGLTRRLQYDASTGMNRLVTATVSKASAEQRKGRAGRLGPGHCYRLYSRHTFESMLHFSPPEILVSDLSSMVLELAAWGVKDAADLSWLDRPPVAAWNSAKELLVRLGSLGDSGNITPQGRKMVRLPLHPRLACLMNRAAELGNIGLGADLAALLSERDIIRRSDPHNMVHAYDPEISERMEILRKWRKGGDVTDIADQWAVRSADRISRQLARMMSKGSEDLADVDVDHDMISRLLIHAFPDRIAKRRDTSKQDDADRFILAQGRGVKFTSVNSLSKSPFIIAARMDAGEKAEGIVHVAAFLTEEIIRMECAGLISTVKRVAWDKGESGIIATVEEHLGAILLSRKNFQPSDEEVVPILSDAVRSNPGILRFSEEARQFQARVALMKKTFRDESWPDLSDGYLFSVPEEWLKPYIAGVKSIQDFARVDIMQALRTMLLWPQMRLLDERAPVSIRVPSGHNVRLDYASGDVPVLAVKLQEMFGLADTPVIADGRVRVLLHLLSPARRPLQITQDLKGFWDGSYQQVKKEMKGRYPKHPWPDDPWNALPTRKTRVR
jgi:ATP-dependent helicase HrpB